MCVGTTPVAESCVSQIIISGVEFLRSDHKRFATVRGTVEVLVVLWTACLHNKARFLGVNKECIQLSI